MYYIIYETINKITGRKYIGKHITENINDNYLGSGIYLQKAIKKYGRENFQKKVLFVFENETDMNNKEKELVNEELINDTNYYNISLGGQGGITVLYKNHPDYQKTCEKIKKIQKQRSQEISENVKKLHLEKKVGMYGKKQSEKQKRLMSEKLKGVKKNPESVKKQIESLKKTLNDPNYVHPNKGRQKKTKLCSHCHRELDSANFARYHGDKCKNKYIDTSSL